MEIISVDEMLAIRRAVASELSTLPAPQLVARQQLRLAVEILYRARGVRVFGHRSANAIG